MNYVTEIPNAFAWVRKAGVYQQASIYQRGEAIFVKIGSGYVRLHAGGATSVPKLAWLEIDPGPDHRLESGDLSPPSLVKRSKRLKKVA